jgi:hypothetical protein
MTEFVRPSEVNHRTAFEEIEKIRKRSKRRPGITAKSLIEEGRIDGICKAAALTGERGDWTLIVLEFARNEESCAFTASACQFRGDEPVHRPI